ncbi:MAG: beta-ketoacyl-[acyl-carrier-protein] synthase family protein [Proteobacteria bacterium]|nr:beta-ketoacyl-[acyl-carrier-protein] synthase family protein [Pseudomonadota bacterium]MBU4296445.1 beta-ketoacyl-[acyl-carrier-protein] synthase family protein [Pseudomonadota bacterium]MCG2748714.1 beta-ketoacyl-[acyl-carrier-protein] synthase family protein [Desulfobulbaceae bacterium]
MSRKRVYIAGVGIISPLGSGPAATQEALRANRSAIRPLDLFTVGHGKPLPVGQVDGLNEPSPLPRTHQLAYIAAMQAMSVCDRPPDAIILGTTTGGILTTEQLLREKVTDKESYRYHGLASVAEYIAGEFGCKGPALVVSTACSSGAVAIALARQMLLCGKAATVLVGGVDCLCRLTYFGFHSLQLVDQQGCRPLDRDRHGMAVAEGAAMLLLTTQKPARPLAELLGAGLSCDAYHPAAPHPEGRGALMAMQAALADAGLNPADIDYINLHGTGTPENDLAEAKAVNTLFAAPPPLSSIKGATGHSLAASGAIEAVVSTIAVSADILPANTGCRHPDPILGLLPLAGPISQRITAVLSNSFGFGGNNGSLAITRPDSFSPAASPSQFLTGLAIHGCSCFTGAGDTAATMALLAQGAPVSGLADLETIARNLPPRLIRRLKRLSRMTLSLAAGAVANSGLDDKPASVFMGTGWGALSETYDFLTALADSGDQFASPTDFVGSVHNGPAGQVAIMFGATGANITSSGGDFSFEQALLAADLLLADTGGKALVLGADEGHHVLAPLFDPSIAPHAALADGGGAFFLSRKREGAACLAHLPFYQSRTTEGCIDLLLESLGGAPTLKDRYALLLAGIPAAAREEGERQLAGFLKKSGLEVPVVRYREFTGEFASASAVAAVMAVSYLIKGKVPGKLVAGEDITLTGNTGSILVLGLGCSLSAMVFSRP